MRIELKAIAKLMACWLAGFVLVSTSQVLFAHGDNDYSGAAATSTFAATAAATDPRSVAQTFNRALAMGDADTVLSLLHPDVLIYESGGAETSAAEYASHHMPTDMAFLANLKREQISHASGGDNKNAWVATLSRLHGRFNGADVDLSSTETLMMVNTDAGWRITHIHWSSAPDGNTQP